MASDEKIAWAVDEVDRLLDERIPTVTREALAQVRDLESQVAALSEALGEQAAGRAAWQARAEALERVVEELERRADSYEKGEESDSPGAMIRWRGLAAGSRDAANLIRQALSAPRPSPSRILGVVRAAAGVCRDTPRSLFDGSPDTDHEDLDEALEALDHALETLTPEERQALGEDTS